MNQPSLDTLSDRARDVAERLQRGERTSEIARALGMKSANGVYQHKRRLEDKGFRFPKAGRGRPRKVLGNVQKAADAPKVVTNGSLVHLLGDTKTDLGKRIEAIDGVEQANADERQRIEAEINERRERLDTLSHEGESLTVTRNALATAREEIPA